VVLWPGGACEWSPSIADEEEQTLLRSAESRGLSVERIAPSSLRPHRLAFTDTMDPGTLWRLSSIWLWNKANPGDIGPLGVFLPVGLYGKIPICFSRSQLTAVARCLHGSFLTSRLDYVSRRETLFRGSLGSGGNVCTVPFALWSNYSHLLALWSPPYIRSPSLHLIQWLTKPLCRWHALVLF
jgi:hypothetical protein